MRELRVEDALLYLDQVKMEFGDQPHIYNEFLDIMKTFKTQQLDTPGVIRRVSSLFRGNRKLVLGFNTFLPEGYKIEIPLDGDGPPVAVYRAPGQASVTHILGPPSAAHSAHSSRGPPGSQAPSHATAAERGNSMLSSAMSQAAMRQGHPQQALQRGPGQQGQTVAGAAGGGMPLDQGAAGSSDSYQQHVLHSQQQQQQQHSMQMQQAAQRSQASQQMMAADGAAGVNRMSGEARGDGRVDQQQQRQPPEDGAHMGGPAPAMQSMQQHGLHGQAPPQQEQQQQQPAAQAPVEFDHAINYVTTIKKRFATEPETYKKFLEILHTYQKEQRGIKEVLDEVSVLFAEHPDLLKEFTYFLPDAVQAQAKAQLDQVAKESEARKRAATSKQAIMQTAQGMQRQAHGLPARTQPVIPTSASVGRPASQVYSSAAAPIPFGATQGRTDEREREICRSSIYGSVSYAPVRPPRR